MSNYLNYVDPSGHFPLVPVIPSKIASLNTDITWDEVKDKASEIFEKIDSATGKLSSFSKGVAGSLAKAAVDKPALWLYPVYSFEENLYNAVQQALHPWPTSIAA